MSGVEEPAGRRGDALDRDLELRKAVGEQTVADVEVHRVDTQVMLLGERERVVDLLVEDAELGRPRSRVEGLVRQRVRPATPRRSGPGVHADADRRAGRAPPPPVELREQVDVHVHSGVDDRVQVAIRQVRARVADLVGRPTVLEGVMNLARRARVESDVAETPDEREDLRLALRLQGKPEPEGDAGSGEGIDQTPSLLLDPRKVVREHGRAVVPSHRFRVAAGDEESAVANLEARALPPRAHVGARC
jgi:hypothetical protein